LGLQVGSGLDDREILATKNLRSKVFGGFAFKEVSDLFQNINLLKKNARRQNPLLFLYHFPKVSSTAHAHTHSTQKKREKMYF